MPRGVKSDLGAVRIAPNGYEYTKVERDGEEIWMATHHIIAEQTLGRPLKPNERVCFHKGKDLDPDNIYVVEKKSTARRRRIQYLKDRIAAMQAELKELEQQ